MKRSKSEIIFFKLVQSGLWGHRCQFNSLDEIDFSEVYRLAEEQAVVGLVAAGIDNIEGVRVPKKNVLPFISKTIQLEQKNQAMNHFIGGLMEEMREAGIYALLVKGQGIAQCYETPFWRSCGDVDFLLNDQYYEKAKGYLIPLASKVDPENLYEKHQGLSFDSWVVELHGNLYCGLSPRIEKGMEEVQKSIFSGGDVRSWTNENTEIFLPGPDSDVLIVFTHILKHFYRGGIGLRQICDWVRLLWTYKRVIDLDLLERRLADMGLLAEWKAFGAFAVDYLGLSTEVMPLYSTEKRWKRKATMICSFILQVGNFGGNRDLSYYKKYPFFIRKAISFGYRFGDLCRHALIFPNDSIRFFPSIVLNGFRSAIKG